jgi:hypothetical protein
MDALTQWLIRHAARRAPCLSARLEEEWLADLAFRPSAASRMRFALGCCWATMMIINDESRTWAPASSPEVAMKGFIAPPDRNFTYVSLRSGTLFLIVGLHAAVFGGLITTLSHARGVSTPTSLDAYQLRAVPREMQIHTVPDRGF